MVDSAQPIVVGVDGTISARHAARWAGALAVRLGSRLHIVHALPYSGHNLTDAMAAFQAAYIDEQREAAHPILDAVSSAVREDHPDLEITTAALTENVDEAMQSLSRHARMLVLGCDELSPSVALIVGSLTLHLTAHAECPVVAWRGELLSPTAQPIVVGVDGSSDGAVDLGFELANAVGAPLWAVHSWSMRTPPGEVSIPIFIDWDALETLQREELVNAVEPYRRKYPDVEVSLFVDAAKPRRALLQRLGEAQLVVVGSRGRNPLAATVLGSTSLNMLHHSPVPVAVCRPRPADL
ncbi:universal stress protein [Mycolicibacterium fluoranthenivorans]|uniref:Nucleotide-binding universal stress protein, UspA family n=1 Tax=Mycolicibacterium fluoranthenivorans TaxID=258505 RepID=A0A1G4WS22_9MYCO|nr:universal stress protein [Mycolicibacterium fluoranthenivorans]SCX27822.1 Nucleotide-binding universal stress protein, UspA family [Mycolicibacterium fluoranthenivorans]